MRQVRALTWFGIVSLGAFGPGHYRGNPPNSKGLPPGTIAFPRPNTITLLSCKPNVMLSLPPWRRGPAFAPRRLDRAHLRAQGLDEILDMKRQRRAALHRDIGVESRRLGDLDQLDAGIAPMGHRELVDDGDAEPRLDQRTDRGAEAGADGDVVLEAVAREDLGHDPPVGIVGIDADQRIGRDLGGGDLLAPGELVARRHDGIELARGERHEVEPGMLQAVAHRHALAAAEHEIVDGFLELENVDVNAEIRIAPPDPLDRARHHDLRNAWHRSDAQFRQSAASDL